MFNCYSQTKTIEQAKKQIKQSKTTLQQLNALFQLCEQRQSLSTDTLRKYAYKAKRLSLTVKNSLKIAWADYYIANYHVKNGQLDSALSLCNKLLDDRVIRQGDVSAWLKLSALKAQVFVKSNKYKEGMTQFYETLSKAEQSGDTLMQMVAKNGVGWVNMEMAQNTEALKWFHRALQTSGNQLLHQKNSNIYSNIAAVSIALGRYDSADYYINKAIAFATTDENLFFLSNSLNILADNYIHVNRPLLAEAPLREALKIREQIGDPFYVVSDLSQLALFYAQQKQPEKGIAASLKGIEIARKYQLVAKLPYLQFALAKNYKAAGHYARYGETLEGVLLLKDSVYQQNTARELAEIRARYNQQKQENLIIQQELSLNKKNALMYGSLIIVFFGVVIALLIFNDYKQKQKRLVEKIKEEEARKVQQAVKAAQENERKRISADLHDNLGAYASAISANVDDLLAFNSTEHTTIINNIKSNADDILNSLNETIWVLKKSEIYLTNIADRFKDYVSRISDTYPEISININETIRENIPLSLEAALNMLRIMQEAFHNAIKHSKGNCITIDIVSDAGVEISIADNGEGFTCIKNAQGNGIANMQKRASENGWHLSVTRGVPKGTVVQLTT